MNGINKTRNITLFFGLFTFLAVFPAMKRVVLYGDDYYYVTFLKMTSSEFWASHFNHYMEVNGRAIVHILDTFFLKIPVVWQVVNSLFLTLFVVLGIKIIAPNKNLLLTVGIILTAGIFCLDISVTRQSIYWITGSFNYVYPFALLMILWFFISRLKAGNFMFACIFAFFSAATTEQNAMMTVGLLSLYFSAGLFFEKRFDKKLLILLIISLAGGCTVLLAPATFFRYKIENEEQTSSLVIIFDNLKYFYANFIAFKGSFYYQALFLTASAVFTFKSYSKKSIKAVLFLLPVILIILYLETLNRTAVFTLARLIPVAITGLYYTAVVITTALALIRKKEKLPLTALILAAGSQAMMLVSPVYGPRNMLCAIFLLTFYSAVLTKLSLSGEGKVNKIALIALLTVISVFGCFKMYKTIDGYKTNKPVDIENARKIEEYKNSGGNGPLLLNKLIFKEHGWSMPYESNYHLYYYKIYYGLDKDTQIEWLN